VAGLHVEVDCAVRGCCQLAKMWCFDLPIGVELERGSLSLKLFQKTGTPVGSLLYPLQSTMCVLYFCLALSQLPGSSVDRPPPSKTLNLCPIMQPGGALNADIYVSISHMWSMRDIPILQFGVKL
jgi:hypothetical protein